DAPVDPLDVQLSFDDTDDDADSAMSLGKQVLALRAWAEQQRKDGLTGDRDDAPTHSPRAWSQISIPGNECVGPTCPYAPECFVQAVRAQAATSQLVVTNHALVAIEATHGWAGLDPDVLVLDEAHGLADRVTASQTDELSPRLVDRAVRMAAGLLTDDSTNELRTAAEDFADWLDSKPPGRIRALEDLDAVAGLRTAMRHGLSAIGRDTSDPRKEQVANAIKQIFDVTDRVAGTNEADVRWVSDRAQFGKQIVVAPLRVDQAIRASVLSHQTSILTSATLTLGDSFGPIAATVGLTGDIDPEDTNSQGTYSPGGHPGNTDPSDADSETTTSRDADAETTVSRDSDSDSTHTRDTDLDGANPQDSDQGGKGTGGTLSRGANSGNTNSQGTDLDYTATDVGSPFDYRSQGICYVASHLPPPGRDGTSDETLQEIADLVEAADGHTLGLFSSLRAAQRAAEHVRTVSDKEVLLQSEGHLPELIAQFIAEPGTSLFGTLSLWQGVDAPGATCSLVIVDRIPFPRPDEPLIQARQEDVSRRGGNGFMEVAAAHAGLMLAQGTGRLIRRTTDQGVVAILDSRLLKARYGPFLVASMPPWWMTTDRAVVLQALRRLNPVDSPRDASGVSDEDSPDDGATVDR
ncbi:MAG: hypothetical protein FWF43_01610, partial [Propionibacteriaceae bacterium]|nr:hypothetical protein [Propionibacteriaceae bacterium]